MNKLKIYLTACSLAAINSGAIAATSVDVNTEFHAVSSISAVEDNITVTGKVKGNDGNPLPGVTVSVKGSSNGTITDADGIFSIEVPENGELILSYAGYLAQTVSINDTKDLGVIILELDDNKIVHTAFKDEKADEILGGVSYVNIDEIIDKNYFNYTINFVNLNNSL